ncbi:MAG TPA: pitrilysin family protein [Candidatus Binatia bacterium]|nr:pitrilysin family protein [Candidatus Binatia bacterium]
MNQSLSTDSVAKKSKTEIYKLDNGLQVVLREDHFAPVVAQQVWVKAGGADEVDVEAGIAHVHEHMLFKGTARRGVGEIAGAVESSGGSINAWTSWDQTVYHLVLASRFAAEGIDILADAVQFSSFDPTELAKELDVVMEEYKRGMDSPSNRIYDTLFETAYTAHPYKRSVIGTETSIKGLTRDMILDFYRRYYTPSNMTVVVVGDFDSRDMRREIEKRFGDFKDKPVPRPQRTVEPAQNETRMASVSMEIQEAQLALGFHIPDANHPDTPALDMLAHVLGGGESSRLYRRLVATTGLATSASAFAYTPPDPGLFLTTASFEADDEDKVLAALIEEVARIRDYPASADEIERARANLESDFVYRRQTVQGQARELGYSIVVHGDPDYPDRYIEKIRAVGAADLQRVARHYLTDENLTGVSLRPKGERERITLARLQQAARPLDSKAPKVAASTDAGREAPPVTPRALGQVKDTEPRLHTLSNGVRIIVQEHHAVPLFSVRAAVLGGLLSETRTNNGISNFVAEMLTRGTASYSRERLASEIESLAGDVSGFSGRSSFGVSGTFLSEHLAQGMDLTLEVLLRPGFPADEVEKTRRELLLAIKNRNDESAQRAFDLAYHTVYPTHPYGLTVLGEADSIGKLKADDLRRYYREVLDPQSLVVTVVGDIDEQDVVARLEQSLGSLQGDGRVFEAPPPAPIPGAPQRARMDSIRKQSHVVVAFPGVAVTDPDKHPLSVLDTVLSRQGGRLFYELRDKQALCYSVTSFSSEGYAPGLFGAYIATDPANEQRALDGLMVELEKVRSEPVKREELERAHRYLIGNYEIALQTNSAIAENMTFNELYGLGYLEGRRYADKIRAVDTEDVQRVAQRFIDLNARTEAVVGPPPAKAAASGGGRR